MAPFEELQSLWQKQTPAMRSAADAAEVAKAIDRFRRLQIGKAILKVSLILAQVFWLGYRLRHTTLGLLGAAAIVSAEIAFLVTEWRNQRAITRLNFADSSLEFVRDALERLNRHRRPGKALSLMVVISVAIGVNLIYFARLGAEPLPTRLLLHAFGTVLPFIAWPAGIWIRGKRFQSECGPLMERLTALQRAIEEPVE